ncbi:MAG: insulinase family protein, partial [Bacteroidales bacterium]|nr:insulinase family protein [Bacteroidales bacterium]
MLLPNPQPLTDFVWASPENRRLSTGISLSLIRSCREDVIRLDVLIRGGTWHQKKCLQAVLTNRMLREGTLRQDSSEIAIALDHCGAALEQSATATHCILTLYCLRKHFAKLLDVVHDMLNCPTFNEKQFRTVIDMNKQNTIISNRQVDMMAH